MRFFIFRYARKSILFIDECHQNDSSLEYCPKIFEESFPFGKSFSKILGRFQKKKKKSFVFFKVPLKVLNIIRKLILVCKKINS